MNKYSFIISAIALFVVISCNNQNFESIDLKGEWVSEINNRYVFSFSHDRCSYISPTGNFASYQLNSNTIVISDTTQRRKKQNVKEYKFIIEEFDDNSMTLITDTTTLKTQFKYGDPSKFDTFKLKRLTPFHKNIVSSIEFESSQCYGSCPSMKLNIDSIGNIKYEGRAYTEKNGYYTGKLTDEKLTTLFQKINYINFDSIKPKYSAMWTDDQTCKLTMNFNNKTVKTSVYGFNKEPIELRILFNELMEMYKSIDMKRDSLHKFYFDDYF